MLREIFGRRLAWLTGVLLAVGLSACSDDAVVSTNLTGTAATGAPVAGFVYVKDAAGTEVNIATGTNGSFTLNVSGMTAPFMVRVVPDNGDPTLYSYASAVGQIVNVTPLTNMAMFMANSNADLAAVYSAWNGSGIAASAIATAQATINANFQARLTAAGVNYASYNFMNTAFSANGTGVDGMMDDLRISVVAGVGVTVTNGSGGSVAFNVNIDVSAIVIGGTGGTGGTLPAGVAGQVVNMEYCCAAGGSPYGNGDQVLFTFSSSGMLTLTDQYTVVASTFTVRGSEYVWTDSASSIEYVLSLQNGAIHEVNVMSTSGTFLGQFAPIAGGGGVPTASQWTLNISGSYVEDIGGSPFTVNIGPMTLTGPFPAPSVTMVEAAVTSSYGAAGTVTVTPIADTATQISFRLQFAGVTGGGTNLEYDLTYEYNII